MQDSARKRIADNIRAEMARRQMSQRDAGEILSLPQNSINLRLRGLRSFRAEELAQIAAWLGVPADQLLAGAAEIERVAA